MEFKRSKSSSKIAITTEHTNNPFNKYQIGQMLGQGQFGKVYKAYLKANQLYSTLNNYSNVSNNRSFNFTGNNKSKHQSKDRKESIYAAKIIPLGKLKKNPKLKQLLTNQIQILSSLKHENIIKFQQLFIWEDKIYMIYEYCQGGDLQDMLPLQQHKALDVFIKIISACSLAEKNNILHRDLKPANILFKKGNPRVADWGFSRYLKQQFTASSFVGSPAYMAPELLKGSEYTNKADVWSFGVMVYQCLFNQMPWPAKTIRDLLQKLKLTPLRFPKQINPILKTIIKLCLEVDPQKRTTFKKLQKIVNASFKILKTQQQNPQEIGFNQQLSPSDIRKCSYYLQFAKQAQKFQDVQAKDLSLQLILNNLKAIKRINFEPKSHITPCLSQRQMSYNKRQIVSPKTSNKLTKRQSRYSYQNNQTYLLLDKQILLIQKIKQNFCTTKPSQSSTRQNTSLALHSTKCSESQQSSNLISQKILIKKILKKLIKNISILEVPKFEQNSANKYDSISKKCKINRRQLMQMNCILQIIMFQQLSEQAKNKKLSDKIKQMQEVGINALIRSVNHRILYINQHYCR